MYFHVYNAKVAYLCHSASKFDPVCLHLAPVDDSDRGRERYFAHAMECPKLRGVVGRNVVHFLASIQAYLARRARYFRPVAISASGGRASCRQLL